jgi:hypothetical protein
MHIQTKSVQATIEDIESDSGPGEFEVVLATSDLDRDGDTLLGDEWEVPLPQRIQFNTDHDHSVSATVGSAVPRLEGDKIVCRGTYATTQHAQDTRQLVRDGHITNVSVAYREKRDKKSAKPSRELINGSFVVVPANTKAVVLESKSSEIVSVDVLPSEPMERLLTMLKSVSDKLDQLFVKGHNDGVSQDVSASVAPVTADLPAGQNDNEALILARAKAIALTLQTRHESD